LFIVQGRSLYQKGWTWLTRGGTQVLY